MPAICKTTCLLVVLCSMTSMTLSAQTYTTIFTFDGTDGAISEGALVQGLDANLYGTTLQGGPHNYGTAFKITTSGALTTIVDFCARMQTDDCPDGASPTSGLTLATDGSLVGTTMRGGANDEGTIYRLRAPNHFTTVHSFCTPPNCADGLDSVGGLVQTFDGSFFGTTAGGSGNYTAGTIFKITPTGSLTTLYSGCSLGCDADDSPSGPLVQAPDGNLYAASYFGGANGRGTFYKIAPDGTLTILYSFCSQPNCTDGSYPVAGMLLASDGNFYGVTTAGGSADYGTAFRITPSGTLATLYSFCQVGGYPVCSDGWDPNAALIQATNGNLYGTTSSGGANMCSYGFPCGIVFKITPNGEESTVYNLTEADGGMPGAIVQDTDGNIYGYTEKTIFRLSLGLGPFVEAVPYAARVGDTIKIFGQALAGTTVVAFNGIPANFKVVTDTYLLATVPAGRAAGTLTVTTPLGTLTSNRQFLLLP